MTPYEPPESPEIKLRSHEMSLESEVSTIINYLNECGIIKAKKNE